MENTKHLSLDYGNLSKGKPTLKFKNELAQNLIIGTIEIDLKNRVNSLILENTTF